jgi:membrane-bound lytic murein transglycosylase D
LKPGSTLLMPSTRGHSGDISAAVAEHAVLAVEPNVRSVRYVLVRMRRGETIARLAQRYGVTTAQIRVWNKERRVAYRPGQLVMLHLPVKTARLYLAQAERPRASRARRGRRSVELAMVLPRANRRSQFRHARAIRVAQRVPSHRLADRLHSKKEYASRRTLRYSSRDSRIAARARSERVANAEKFRKQQEG